MKGVFQNRQALLLLKALSCEWPAVRVVKDSKNSSSLNPHSRAEAPERRGKFRPERLETRDELYAASSCVLGVGLGFSCCLDMGEGVHLASVRTPHTLHCLLGAAPSEAGCYLVIRAEPWVQNSGFLAFLLALVQAVSVGSCKKPGADT